MAKRQMVQVKVETPTVTITPEQAESLERNGFVTIKREDGTVQTIGTVPFSFYVKTIIWLIIAFAIAVYVHGGENEFLVAFMTGIYVFPVMIAWMIYWGIMKFIARLIVKGNK